MVNRVLQKKIKTKDGVKFAEDVIKEGLRSNGDMSFSQIRQHLAQKGIEYADNRGLANVLNKMRSEGKIGKHKVSGRSYPVYYNIVEGLENIVSQAQEFRRGVWWDIEKFPNLVQKGSEPKEEYFLRNLIHIFGLYMLYTQIQSWEYTSKMIPHVQNSEIRSAWLDNTVPMGKESHLLEEGIRDLVGLRFYNNPEEFTESISQIYDNTKKKNKLLELRKLLENLYPKEMEFFDTIIKKSPDEAKKTKEWIRDIQKHEAWKKRTVRKNLKNPKRNLKSNQCPMCYYDGTTKVKAGQCKGMIFPAGYVNEFTNEEGEHWHCPACGHWEIKPTTMK